MSQQGDTAMNTKRGIISAVVGGLAFIGLGGYVVAACGAMMGEFFLLGVMSARRIVTVVHVVLCAAVIGLCLVKSRPAKARILPWAIAGIELVAGALFVLLGGQLIWMQQLSPEVCAIASQWLRMAGLGMLIGSILACITGPLVAKGRMFLPALVIILAALTAGAGTWWLLMQVGAVSAVTIGLFQPFAIILPAFASVDGVGVMPHFASVARVDAKGPPTWLPTSISTNKHKGECMLFSNIGGKLKTLATVLCAAGIGISVICGIILIGVGAFSGEGAVALYGFIVMIAGALLSWIAAMFTYGFGELIENTTVIAELSARADAEKHPAD